MRTRVLCISALLWIGSGCGGGESALEPGTTQPPQVSPQEESPPDQEQVDITTTTVGVTTTSPVTTTTLFPPAVTFCDSLEIFFDAWLIYDTLDTGDLTPAYQALGEIAPEELVVPFQVLADGNAILVATRDRDQLPDADTYDASGAAVAEYATDECGLTVAGP